MANYENLGNNKVKYTVTVPADVFDKGIESAYKKNASRYALPGFRKGKAPRKMLERAYGKELFYMEAVEEVYWDAYVADVKESDEYPVEMPELNIVDVGEGKDLVFEATVTVRPKVQLEDAQYKGIEVVKVEYNVTDAMVDAKLAQEQEQMARYIDAGRPVEQGDRVTLDYSGAVDGEKFEGGTAEGQTLDIGSGHFIPGFEEQLVGMTEGETRDITVTFPEQYHAENLAGKEAVFTVTIHEIKFKELPALDDEFAKDVSEYDTLQQFRDDIRAKLQKDADGRKQSQLRNNAVDSLVKKIDIEIPGAMIDHQVDSTIQDMQMRMAYQGMKFEDYLKYTGSSEEKLRQDIRPDAEHRVIADLALDAIIKKEDVKASPEEVDKEISDMAEQYGKTPEEVRTMIGERMEGVEYELAVTKAVDLILENAVFIDPPKAEKAEENN